MGNPQPSPVSTTGEGSTTSPEGRKPRRQRGVVVETGVTKVCRVCLTAKDLGHFYFRNDSKKYRRECRECMVHQHRTYKFGIAREQWDAMYAKNKGRCWICHAKPKQALAVDHCHKSGKVRGLLCSNCNTGLGLFRDNQNLLTRAIQYLREDIV